MDAIILYLGYLAALFISYKIARKSIAFIKNYIFSSPLNVSNLGKWALVTGSTDGIGKAYAYALAKKRLNVFLVSRTPYKLQNVAAEIEAKYKVETRILDIDFSIADSSSYMSRLEKATEDLEIGVLVNNVGMNVDYPQCFLDMDNEMIKKIMDVNLTSLNFMTKLVMPKMVEREKGAVINIGSLASEVPNPMYSVYAASKSYTRKFSEILNQEYGRKGVTVQCITPGYVVSNMSKIKRSSYMAPTPEVFVRSALKTLGIYTVTTGYFCHDLLQGILNFLPPVLAEKIVWDEIVKVQKKALSKKKNKDQ